MSTNVQAQPIDVALCGDRNVLPGIAVSVRSAIEHASRPINVHVLCSGVSERDKAKLSQSWAHPNCAKVIFADIDTQKLRSFRSTAYLKSKVAYARYFIGELFPDLSRCVYLDTDLLVLRDLAEAFDVDLGDNLAAAVLDVSVRFHGGNNDRKGRLGLRDERNYFNSGFMVLDLDGWRREDLARKLIEISIARFDTLDSQDQDALNAVLEDRTLLLDTRWNISQYEKPFPLEGHVVHLIGPAKPWHALYKSNFKEPYFEDVVFKSFTDTLDRTAYRGWRPTDPWRLRSCAEIVKRKIPTRDMLLGKFRRTAARFGVGPRLKA